MGNKTRRKGQKRRVTRRKGGAIDKLPDVTDAMTLVEFESKYDVFYIRAHGGLLSTQFTVPRNTYLLHSVPSTLSCTFPVDDERLDRFYKPEGRYNASNSYGIIEPNETDDHFMKFVKNPKSLFEYTYSKRNLAEFHRFNDDRIPARTSIYEPYDSVNDITLQFYSHSVVSSAEGGVTHFIAPGIFKIPISNGIKKLRDNYLEVINSLRTSPHIDSELEKVDRDFISKKENLLHLIANKDKYTVELSELLSMPQLQPAKGKKRLVIIHACKSAPSATEKEKKAVRRRSIERVIGSELLREPLENNVPEVAPFVPRSVLVNRATPTWNTLLGYNMMPVNGQIVFNVPPPKKSVTKNLTPKKSSGLKGLAGIFATKPKMP